MNRTNIENDEASAKTTDESIDLFSLVFHRTILLNEEDQRYTRDASSRR